MEVNYLKLNKKYVICAALSGAATMKQQNPAVPYTPEEFAEEAYRCYQEGAAIVHVHARDPETGIPTENIDQIRRVVDAIRDRCPILINLSTAIRAEVPAEARIKPIEVIKPEMASLNTGSMNFGLVNRKTGEVLAETVFENTFSMLSHFAQIMKDNKVKPELEVYDLGHVENVKMISAKGVFEEPRHYNFLFGIAGGMPFSVINLAAYIASAPQGATWVATGVGPLQPILNNLSLALGGNVRVGLEDNIWIRDGVLAKGSYEQVALAVKMGETLGREPATPNEARVLLNLPER